MGMAKPWRRESPRIELRRRRRLPPLEGRAEISKYLTEQWGAQKNRTQKCELYVGSATRVVMSVEREWSDANEPWKTISEKGMVCWELDAGLVSKRVFVVEPSASA